MKKALFIGGTGVISAAISARLLGTGWQLHLLNRGNLAQKHIHPEFELAGARFIAADIQDEAAVAAALKGEEYDVVADFIAYRPQDVQRDYRLFAGKTGQYLFISSASAYQKPLSALPVTESTPLANPYWQYSRDKIACEELLMRLYREEGFPATLVRPSHTYDQRSIPLAIHGAAGSWETVRRIAEGKPILLHGDGASLWTFTHSRDFAHAFAGLMGNLHAIGQAVQITADESLTWNQAIACLGRAVGKRPHVIYAPSGLIVREGRAFGYDFEGPLLGDKSHSVLFDNSKIKALVPGFCATTRFDEGIAQSVEWYRQNPALQREDDKFSQFLNHMAGGSFGLGG